MSFFMKEVSSYYIALACLGFAISLMAFIPVYSKKLKITYIIPLLLMGILMYIFKVPLPWPEPLWDFKIGKIITEVIVIISLMTAGLKIGTNYNLTDWKKPFALILITMPLFMVAVFLISKYILGLSNVLSLLLAAVLVPTDPVLANEMQLEEHQDLKEKNTGLRFTLTAEAGINDGVAFPFIFLAILYSQASSFSAIDWPYFLSYYVVYKIIVGSIIGCAIGYVYSYFAHRHNKKDKQNILSGFIALALTFLSYGVGEIFHGYGFISVFCSGIFMQYFSKKRKQDRIKNTMLHYVEETEKMLVAIWTIFFGGAIMSGILNYTDFTGIIISLVIVLLIRPITGYLAMLTTNFNWHKKFAIGFFGIKGIGSFFYLSFALIHGNFEGYEELIGIVSYVILFSIIIHGLTSLRVINFFKNYNSK